MPSTFFHPQEESEAEMGSFFYDDFYDYGDLDLSVGGLLGGLLGGFGSFFDGFFSYDYDDDYDYYGYYGSYWDDDWDDEYDFTGGDNDTSITVDSYDSMSGLGDLGILGTIFGLLDGSSSLSVNGLFGLLDGLLGDVGDLFGDLYDYESYYGDDDGASFGVIGDVGDLNGLLPSILGLLGNADFTLSVDGGIGDVDGLLSSIVGLLGGDDATVTVDGESTDVGGFFTSILGLFGGDDASGEDGGISDSTAFLTSFLGLLGEDGTTFSVDGEMADAGAFLSSILGLLGNDGAGLSLTVDSELGDTGSFLSSFLTLFGTGDTALTVDTESSDLNGILSSILGGGSGLDLSSILGLLGGSGATLTVGSENPASSGLDLSSILALLGGSGSSLCVEGSTASSGLDLSSILALLGGSGTSTAVEGSTASSGLDLSSILALLGGSGTSSSVEGSTASSGLDLSSILSLLGGSGTSLSVEGSTASSGLDLSSILALLGGSGTSLSVEGSTASSGLDLSSILALLGGSGSSTTIEGSTVASSGLDLSSILALLGGSGTSLNISGSTTGLSNLGNLFSGLAALYNGIANMDNTTGEASWEDLAFLDDLQNVLPNSGTGTSLDLSSILALLGGSGTSTAVEGSTVASNGIDLSSILALLGGSGSSITVDNATSTTPSPTVSAIPSTTGSTQTSDLKALLDALADNNAKLKLDITLTTEDGSTATIQFDGFLSTFLNNLPTTLTVNSSFEDLIAPYYKTTVSVVPTEEFCVLPKPEPDAVAVSWESTLAAAAGNPQSTILENTQFSGGYLVEIATDSAFDGAVRIFTTDTAFDVDGSAGAFAVRATAKGGDFSDDSAEWTSDVNEPRRIVSNGNGVADVFFASAAEGDVWSANYYAQNAITGETAAIDGKNRIRDTFSGSESDANILYLTDAANGDALFMDDVYSEFGDAARLSLIREVRSGAGDDVVDMTAEHFASELAGMTVRGGSGDDVLWGADGGNRLFGDDGADKITGGSGDDVIAGGDGNDTLNGGGGNDVFTFGNDWGADVVTQLAGGSVTLWFAEPESMIRTAELAGNTLFMNATGSSVVMVQGFSLADITVKYGDDGSDEFAALSASGAFLGSTADSVFETQAMRSRGILASL